MNPTPVSRSFAPPLGVFQGHSLLRPAAAGPVSSVAEDLLLRLHQDINHRDHIQAYGTFFATSLSKTPWSWSVLQKWLHKRAMQRLIGTHLIVARGPDGSAVLLERHGEHVVRIYPDPLFVPKPLRDLSSDERTALFDAAHTVWSERMRGALLRFTKHHHDDAPTPLWCAFADELLFNQRHWAMSTLVRQALFVATQRGYPTPMQLPRIRFTQAQAHRDGLGGIHIAPPTVLLDDRGAQRGVAPYGYEHPLVTQLAARLATLPLASVFLPQAPQPFRNPRAAHTAQPLLRMQTHAWTFQDRNASAGSAHDKLRRLQEWDAMPRIHPDPSP